MARPAAGLTLAVVCALAGLPAADARRVAPTIANAEALRREQLVLVKAEEEKERDPALAVKPGSGASFRDRTAGGAPCPECPEMVAVPAGSFAMGSPESEPGRESWQKGIESPQRRVTIARPFAVGRFEVTFAEWDACLANGGCTHRPDDNGWGRGKRPVIGVSWDDITGQYLPWLSGKTGKTYRLLTEAEWEYVARAGTSTPFWWGSSISPGQANYNGAYAYDGGPKGETRGKTGSAWGVGDCSRRVLRGGAWNLFPAGLRAASRLRSASTVLRLPILGFRVGRMLGP